MEHPADIHEPDTHVTHEKEDVDVGSILKFGIALALLFVVVQLLMWGMFKVLNRRTVEAPPGPMALSEEEKLPPGPRLQLSKGYGVDLPDGKRIDLSYDQKPPVEGGPQAEAHEVMREWNEVLDHGTTDQQGKPVVVPIEQAMKQVVQQGLPSRQQQGGSQPFDYAPEVPTFQSSGRVSEKRTQ
jgi:hypothetical protein